MEGEMKTNIEGGSKALENVSQIRCDDCDALAFEVAVSELTGQTLLRCTSCYRIGAMDAEAIHLAAKEHRASKEEKAEGAEGS